MNKSKNQYSDIDFGKQQLRIYPFPPGMHDLIMTQVINKYPIPDPPEKEIDSFAGDEKNPEKVFDFDNPEYKEEKSKVEKKRNDEMAKRILFYTLNECCEVLNKDLMKKDIKRLSQVVDFSSDPHERIVEYIKAHVIKTKDQYAEVIQTAIALSIVDDSEVAEQIKSFQN